MLKVKRFTAKWCQPCKQLAPIFSELQQEFRDNVSFETIDVDESRDAAVQSNVSSVPTVVFEKDGKELYRFTGVRPKSVIGNYIKTYM